MAAIVSPRTSTLDRLMRQSDIVLALGVVSIIAMLIVPLPTALLDVLFVLNISLALTVLLLTMYTRRPLDFSVFP